MNTAFLAKDDEDSGRNYVLSALFAALVIIPLGQWLAPDLIGHSIFDAWSFHGTGLLDWLKLGLPLFGWGVGVNVLAKLFKKEDSLYDRLNSQRVTRGQLLGAGFLISLWAGLAEELSFRWLLYYGAFFTLAIVNFLFFGWAGFGLPEWLHLNLFGPIADFTTLGYLTEQLFDPRTWLVGGAIISANAFFRDGHKYQGIWGMLNSWFVGMFCFYAMFNFGLLAAIVIHFTYDMLIFATVAALHT